MPTLWLRMAEDLPLSALPGGLAPEERARLEALWRRAFQALGLATAEDLGTGRGAGGRPWLRWHADCPYVDWSRAVERVGAGGVEIAQAPEGFAYRPRRRLLSLPRLIAAQWRIEDYVAGRLEAPVPEAPPEAPPEAIDDALAESLALGLALLALTLRLPRHEPATFAAWLADPASAPRAARPTLARILAVQSRRNALSRFWSAAFPPRESGARTAGQGPPHFWDDAPAGTAPSGATGETGEDTGENATPPERAQWAGLPVCPGHVTAEACLADRREPPRGAILVFARATPETTLRFDGAAAVLYAEGGVLAHACCVARERGIPCVTGLGRRFLAEVRDGARLSVDGLSGTVRIEKA